MEARVGTSVGDRGSAGAVEESLLAKLLRKSLKRGREDSNSSDNEGVLDGGAQVKKKCFREASDANKRLCVARVSGFRCVQPKKILATLDRLFAGHNGEDVYESLAKATDSSGMAVVVVDGPGLSNVLESQECRHLSVAGLRQPIYVERLRA